MQLHLLSSSGELFIEDVIEIARPMLEGISEPEVAYLPAASLERSYSRETRAAFRGLAKVTLLKAESDPLKKIRSALDRAALLYIPGGNTFLMAHRLHNRGLVDLIRHYLLAGLPMVGVSAGTMICGVNILTSNDINCCGCVTFSGLNLVPCNFNMHYPPEEGDSRLDRDDRMGQFLQFHDQPVLAMQDDAYIRVTEAGLELVRGTCWRFEKGKEKALLPPGKLASKVLTPR